MASLLAEEEAKNRPAGFGNYSNLLKSEKFCDVTFLVGKEKKPIKGHKVVFAGASTVFTQLFDGDNTKIEFNIEDVEPDIFELFVEFIYNQTWTPDSRNALPLLNCSNSYKVDGLSALCSNFIKTGLTQETAVTLFQQARLHKDENLVAAAKAIICKFGYIIIESDEFLTLDEECIEEILGMDELAVKSEVQLWKALLRWVEAECKRRTKKNEKGEDETPKRGDVLDELIPDVRFAQMTEAEFSLNVAFEDILSSEQLNQVSFFHKIPLTQRIEMAAQNDSLEWIFFDLDPRAYHLPSTNVVLKRLTEASNDVDIDNFVALYAEVTKKGNINYLSSRFWNRICFKSDEEIWMASIGINQIHDRCVEKNSISYTVKIKLLDEQLEEVFARKTEIVKAEKNISDHYQVKFNKPVKIEKNTWYTASLRVVEGKYFGQQYTRDPGLKTVCIDSAGKSVNIEFKNSEISSVDTDVDKGQMASLGFLLY